MKISAKLLLIGAITFVSLAALEFASTQVIAKMEKVNQSLQGKTKTLILVSEINDDISDMLLVAMDMIVDKDSGEVDEALLAEVRSSYSDITKNLAALHELSVDAAFVQELREGNDFLHEQIIQVLVPAVQSRATEATFGELDDSIDGAGAKITERISIARQAMEEEYLQTDSNAIAYLQSAKRNTLIVFAVALVTAGVACFQIARSITSPLKQLLVNIETIAAGEDTEVVAQTRSDEIGAMARALEKLRVQVLEAFRLKTMVDDMPTNVMTVNARDDFKIDYINNTSKKMLASIEHLLPTKASELLGKSMDIFHKNPEHQRRMLADPSHLPHRAKIKVGPETMDLMVSAIRDKRGTYTGAMLTWNLVTQNVKLANDFEDSVGGVSSSVAHAAKSIQQSALVLRASIEQLSASALEISRQTSRSIEIVRDAVGESASAEQQMQNMSMLASKIGDVVTLIRSIADRTNLLALNATIESARAGESGKGFAVVANEVKTLASQTASAITGVTQQIEEIQKNSIAAQSSIKAVAEVVSNINEIATTVASAVEQQQAATQEIARSISGAGERMLAQGMDGIDVMSLSTQLVDISTKLQGECDEFLKKVRAM